VSEPREALLFELVLYLVSCARLSLDEPQIYGSFRLVEAAVRLVDAAGTWGMERDEVLERVRASIEEEKLRMIDDHAGYRAWLDRLLRDLAEEAVARNLGQAGSSG
jgi:Family of unknown function (DUF6092)